MACGEVVEMRCGRASCSVCGPVQALKLAAAMTIAEPERLVTLTQVGASWQERRQRMHHLRTDLTRKVGPFEWAWAVEPNPRRTGYHVHAVEHGARIPQRVLSAAADGVGMGRVADIRRLNARPASSVYVVKLAATAYGMKGARTDLPEYLDANGGRLLHTSRGFWRDGEEPITGSRPRRVAVQRAMGRLHPNLCRHEWSPIGAAV